MKEIGPNITFAFLFLILGVMAFPITKCSSDTIEVEKKPIDTNSI